MENDSGIDLEKLAARVRTKRGDRGLRFIAEEVGGVSASTLSRIEQGSAPDLPTFIRVCEWLGVSPDVFVKSALALKRRAGTDFDISLPDAVEAQLRQDRVLPSSTVNAISEMIRIAYRAAEADRGKEKAAEIDMGERKNS
jgi:transcriptional regulator with XRE-family HTH domain